MTLCSECNRYDAITCWRCRNNQSEEQSRERAKRDVARMEAFTLDMRAKLDRENKRLEDKLAFLGDQHLFDKPDLWLKAGDGGDESAPVAAHRHILASKSPVFRAMLSSDMKEPTTGTVEVTEGCSSEGLKAFVHFLYTAKVDQEFMDSNWEELLDMAVKYYVEELKNECLYHISTIILPKLQLPDVESKTPEEVEETCEVIGSLCKIDHKYGMRAITEAVVEHMLGDEYRNAYHVQFLSSQGFLRLRKLCPLVALDICESIATKSHIAKGQRNRKFKEELGCRLREEFREHCQPRDAADHVQWAWNYGSLWSSK